jgi:hypothetical protein
MRQNSKVGWNIQASWLPIVLVLLFIGWVWIAGPPKASEFKVSEKLEKITLTNAKIKIEGIPGNEIKAISGVNSQVQMRILPQGNFRGDIRLVLRGDPKVIKWLGARLLKEKLYIEGERIITIAFKPMTAYLKTGTYSLNLIAEEEGEVVGGTQLHINLIGAEIAGC